MNKLFWFLPLVLVVGCASKPQIVEVEVPAKPKVADAAVSQPPQPQIIIQQAPTQVPQIQQPAWVVGPSNNPNVVSGFKDVEYMQRNEVIQASKDCIENRMKPVVQYVPQKTTHGTLMLPAMVNCEVIPGYTIVDDKKSSSLMPMDGVLPSLSLGTSNAVQPQVAAQRVLIPDIKLDAGDYWVLDANGAPRPASTMGLLRRK